jgi:hypothetical protein
MLGDIQFHNDGTIEIMGECDVLELLSTKDLQYVDEVSYMPSLKIKTCFLLRR